MAKKKAAKKKRGGGRKKTSKKKTSKKKKTTRKKSPKKKRAKKKTSKKKARRSGKKASKRKRAGRGLWSPEEVKLLKQRFAKNPTAEIAERLGRATDAVKKKAARLGLRKAKSYMKKLGRG